LLAMTALLLAVALSAGAARSDAAELRRCQPIVKKIYAEPGFYKAKVLVVLGDVGCGKARDIIWRALQPGGFFGRIRGWDCEAKGSFDPYAVKCRRSSDSGGEEVIKSGRPRFCESCRANRH
jgi:hypothetical protein